MVSLLYFFKNDPDVLTNNVAYRIVDQGLVYRGNDYGAHMRWKWNVGPLTNTIPETENHVLMTLSSMYLTNQYIYDNPRNDPRLRTGAYANRDDFKNSAAFEDMLLQTMGRIVYSDYFETNGHAYQAFTLHSFFNLYAFANSPTIRAAAKNAIDFTAAKFAFQSLEGKRFSPQRRNIDYAGRMSMYENDPTLFMMDVLSGAYRWDDTVTGDWTKDKGVYFPAAYGNGMGHELWAALFADKNLLGAQAYELPRPIHAFMLGQHDPYWARMQARYTDDHYTGGAWPKYFNGDKTIFSSGSFDAAPEFYYNALSFMNVAGGAASSYPLRTPLGGRPYDFTSRPSIVLPTGHVADWGIDGMGLLANDVINMTSNPSNPPYSSNLGVYKGFTYGTRYIVNGKVDADAVSVPPSWKALQFGADFYPAGARSVRYRFYDLTTWVRDAVNPYKVGYYVVTGNFNTNPTTAADPRRGMVASVTARGFWEVISADRYPDLVSVMSSVLGQNSGDTFREGLPAFTYRMTTGDTLDLAPGITNNPVKRITNSKGAVVPLADIHFDATNPRGMPLIDVREIGADQGFSGRVYAYSSGDGRVYIKNPNESPPELCIDSSQYDAPVETNGPCPGPAGWTPWIDRDDPSGNGDGEHLSLMLQEGYPVCSNPIGVECRRISDQADWTQTGEFATCTTAGFECLNANQPDRSCDDYEVRFFCPKLP
jgi:hypothetical protein